MSARTRASAKWRRKKLDENAIEFRAKEALRIRKHRAQAKEKQRRTLRTCLEDSRHRVVQDENELSDDVDAFFYNAIEGHSQTSHPDKPSHFSSAHPTSLSQSSSRSIENPHNDDETLLTPRPSTTVTFQDARDILANGQKMLQEWDNRWGTIRWDLDKTNNTKKRIGGSMRKVSARSRGELLDMFGKGREALLQLETIAFIDLRSIQADELRNIWIDVIRVAEGLCERIAQVVAALQLEHATVDLDQGS